MRKERFMFGEDMRDRMKDAVPLFQGVSDKNGDLWIIFPDMSVAVSAAKKFWFDMETRFQESLINDDTLDEENRLAVQQKLKLIREGLKLMDEEGIG